MPNLGDNVPIGIDQLNIHFNIEKNLPLTPYSLPLAIWDIVEKGWSYKDLVFTQAHPRENVEHPTIVWSIYRKIPGKEGVETNKPRWRGSVTDETDPGTRYEQYAQWMTILYQFDIYDIDNESTNDLTEDFEELMFHCTTVLKDLGVSEWLFDEQLIDQELERRVSQELYRRSLRYRCILERKFIKTSQNIQSIWVRQGMDMNILAENEVITRGGMIPQDVLQNKWASSIWSITKEYKLQFSSVYSSGTQYLEGVDFELIVTTPNGISWIKWLPKGIHPMPGETYYVTYFYKNVDLNYPIGNVSG
jgi:hypothetical protein